MKNRRLDFLVDTIERDRVNIGVEKIYQGLIKLDGLYDLNVREADALVKKLSL